MSRIHFFGLLSLSAAAFLGATGSARAARTPEAETLAISKLLQPVPDDEWREIAGPKGAEDYVIVRGDTLYDISNRLFGDPRYWPKIWALNNSSITNPHLIMPDNAITFTPGTGSSLPMVAIASADQIQERRKKVKTKTDVPHITSSIPYTKGRSQEWRKLPRQPWESYDEELPEYVDANGFDRNSRVRFGKGARIDMPVYVSHETIVPKGYIEGAISERAFLGVGDEVVLSPEEGEEFQVGDLYGIASDASEIGASESDRSGYSYPYVGKLKITSVRDGLFVATITAMRTQINRGDLIIPLPASPPMPEPIPAPSRIQGTVIRDPALTPGVVSQQRFAIVDRGADDGIKAGMVFRAFDYTDRFSGRDLLDSDFFPRADFIVIYPWGKFSLVIGTQGDSMYENGLGVALLTDVSDLKRGGRQKTIPVFESGGSPKSDELEGLDEKTGIGRREEEELKELEGADLAPQPQPPADEPPPPPEAPAPEVPPPPTDDPPPPPQGDGEELDFGDVAPGADAPPVPEAGAGDVPPAPPETAPPPPASSDAGQIEQLLD